MDDLTMLREALPAAEGPSPDVVMGGRLALLTEARRAQARPPSSKRLPQLSGTWRTRQLIAAGAAAVLVVSAIAFVLRTDRPQTLQVATPITNARQLAERATAAAKHQPYQNPRPHQFAYRKTTSAGGWDMNTWWKGVDANASKESSEAWERVDGGQDAFINVRAELSVSRAICEGTPPTDPNCIHAIGRPTDTLGNYNMLPTDPAALLRRLRSQVPNQVSRLTDADVFQEVNKILAQPVAPKIRAALYGVLSMLGGITFLPTAVDEVGRAGVGFTGNNDYHRDTIVIDPTTFHYLGSYSVAIRDYHRAGDAGSVKKGTRLSSLAQIVAVVVDKPGQRR
jgi:hypothetical protein